MEIFKWSILVLLVSLLVYNFFYKPYRKGIDYSNLKHPDFSIPEEEEVVVVVAEKPAPKKRRPYKKRKPKNDKGEK